VIALAQSNLKDYIYSGKTSPTISLTHFREVCKGVQRLHNLRYCHRDLKPDNFLISPRTLQPQEVWLSDLGTARSLSEDAERFLPSYDFPVGDLRYAPVELWCGLGNYSEMFYAADIFALGATLFEMFTQSILTESVFDREILGNLLHFFQSLTERKDRFDKMLKGITARWQLPDIQDFAPDLPQYITDRINRLYKQLAHLDYRARMSRKDAFGRLDFTPVFQEINRCLTILHHQKAYQELQARKRSYDEYATKKEERRQKRMVGGYNS
jgi:serine/threonine protein kinase